MIVSKCPLRVSLAGGSTDLIEYVELFGRGSVISFPINLYTYIGLSYNDKVHGKYRINITIWVGVDGGFNDETNARRGRLTQNFEVAPFLEHIKENDGGY